MNSKPSTQSPRVVFIEPRSPDSHIFSIYPLPRLGSVLLGTMLEKNGFHVDVLVEEIHPIDIHAIQQADIVGISTTTSTAPRAYAYAALAKELGKPVVLGGPHVTFMADEAIRHADCVVLGEAEHIVIELFRRLADSEPVDDLPGVVTAGNLSSAMNQQTSRVQCLDDLPIPNLNLIRGFNLKDRIFRKVVVPVQASRGCPHDCCFCSVTGMFGRRFRFRSVDHVMEELLEHDARGVSVFFYDDNLAADRKWLLELLEHMARAGTRLKWSAQVRIEVARDRELLGLMRRTGCTTLFIGLESINPETLAAMNKHQTREDIFEAMSRFREYRLPVHGMFILGMDTDTPESIRTTVSWALRGGVRSAQFLILTPFPGTRIYRELGDQGRMLFDDWSLYDGHHVTFQPANMSPAKLQLLQLEAHDRFYSRFRTAQRLATCKLETAGIFLYARRLQHKWRRTNQVFQDLLALMARSHGMIRDVKIEHPARRLGTVQLSC